MKTIADACMIVGWFFYSHLMRFFWIPLAFYVFCLLLTFLFHFNFEKVPALLEKYSVFEKQVDPFLGDALHYRIVLDRQENEDSAIDMFIHPWGYGVFAPPEQRAAGLFPNNPMFLVVFLFPVFLWLFLGFFTVGETLISKRKGIIPSVVGIFSLVLPWTIPTYFKRRERHFFGPFRTRDKRDTTAKRRIFLLVFYAFCGLSLSLAAFWTPHPRFALFTVWFFGGIGIITYTAMFHCLAIGVINRKSRFCRLKTQACAAQHACVGGLAYPPFPLLTSIACYGLSSFSILWTALWLLLVLGCVPLCAAGYTATFVTIFTKVLGGIKRAASGAWRNLQTTRKREPIREESIEAGVETESQ